MKDAKAIKVTVTVELLNASGAVIQHSMGYAVGRDLPVEMPDGHAVAEQALAQLEKVHEGDGKRKRGRKGTPGDGMPDVLLGEEESETPIEAYGGPEKEAAPDRGPFYSPNNI
jgi:hypothetical protein